MDIMTCFHDGFIQNNITNLFNKYYIIQKICNTLHYQNEVYYCLQAVYWYLDVVENRETQTYLKHC